MKDPEYNLLDEPWIPIRLLDGTITNVGLLELVERTSDIADLACELPTQNIAIQRLILAIAYRVATPSNEQEWARQWNEGAPTDRMLGIWKSGEIVSISSAAAIRLCRSLISGQRRTPYQDWKRSSLTSPMVSSSLPLDTEKPLQRFQQPKLPVGWFMFKPSILRVFGLVL